MIRSVLSGCSRLMGVTGNGFRPMRNHFIEVIQTKDAPICSLHTSSKLLIRNTEKAELDEGTDSRDRSKVIPVETSMKYLQSDAYRITYGDDPVWKKYRRNFKGFYPPEVRKKCIRNDRIVTVSACPICRDEYLVLDYRNVDLLKQFISPFDGGILPTKKTQICRVKHKELMVAVEKAWDYGLLTFNVPFRKYDYSEYYQPQDKQEEEQ